MIIAGWILWSIYTLALFLVLIFILVAFILFKCGRISSFNLKIRLGDAIVSLSIYIYLTVLLFGSHII